MENITIAPQDADLPIIDFSYNWNDKLNCKAFTTLRLANSSKYIVGQRYIIQLNKRPTGIAQAVEIKRLQLHQINEFIARIDTGYSVDDCKDTIIRMYKSVDFRTAFLYLILLVKEK